VWAPHEDPDDYVDDDPVGTAIFCIILIVIAGFVLWACNTWV